MAIPSFQVMMRPVLEVLEATGARSLADWRDEVQRRVQISDKQREERLEDSHVRVFDNRVAWAVTHLRLAGLTEGPKGSLWAITESGREFLENHEGPISVKDLQTIPSYVEAWKRVRSF
ncbi:MAG TPA: winged helix-turn-helix domain-containing protein [Syntrophobacteria bacterium]|nr:winged helix-turn-helix domain-containing protein [Syntrophobacteria bacterium]